MAKGTVNKVTILGRLGVDPELRYMPNGNAAINLRIATTDGYKDRNTGEFIENTEWHRVVAFGKPAEIMGQYCKKGTLLYIEGRLKTNKWQDQSGQDRYTTEIVANEFQLIGSKQDSMESNNTAKPFNRSAQSQQQQTSSQHSEASKQQTVPDLNALDAEFDDDEIPF